MNRVRQMAGHVTAILVAAVLTSGCASTALWEKKQFHPADQPDLRLALNPQSRDVLVQYEEQCEDSSKLRHRAYWLFEHATNRGSEGQPVFVRAKDYSGLIPIALLDEEQASNAAAMKGYVAVATPWQQGFDLWQDGTAVGRFYLPVYFAPPPTTVWRVVATPFAALGDTAVALTAAALVLALIGGLAYLEAGAPGLN